MERRQGFWRVAARTVAVLGLVAGVTTNAQEIGPAGFAPRTILDLSQLSPAERDILASVPRISEGPGSVSIRDSDLPGLITVFERDPNADPSNLIDSLAIGQLRARDPNIYQRTFDVDEARSAITNRIKLLRDLCKTQGDSGPARQDCETRLGVPGLVETGRRLNQTPQLCRLAADEFQRTESCRGERCVTPAAKEIIREFDRQCLFEPSGHGQGGLDPNPPAAVQLDSQGLTALDAVAMIQRQDQPGRWTHVCGGLLLSGGRVLTARHCILHHPVDHRELLKRGDLRAVRSSDGKPFSLAWTDDADIRPLSVASDYIVLPLASGQPPPDVPRMAFRAPLRSGGATTIGYFHFYALTLDTPDASLLDPRRGLRYPGPGLCHVMEAVRGCVRTICQTVPGYSGAPLFAEERDADGSLVVHGLISSPAVQGAMPCAAPGFGTRAFEADTISTAAAFPAGVTP